MRSNLRQARAEEFHNLFVHVCVAHVRIVQMFTCGGPHAFKHIECQGTTRWQRNRLLLKQERLCRVLFVDLSNGLDAFFFQLGERVARRLLVWGSPRFQCNK